MRPYLRIYILNLFITKHLRVATINKTLNYDFLKIDSDYFNQFLHKCNLGSYLNVLTLNTSKTVNVTKYLQDSKYFSFLSARYKKLTFFFTTLGFHLFSVINSNRPDQ